MASVFELFRNEERVTHSIVHPGITFTNITSHYPKIIFAIIKHPMKILFPHPRRAALSAVQGIFTPCGYREWIGPRILDIWGLPAKRRLRGISDEESLRIAQAAEEIYGKL